MKEFEDLTGRKFGLLTVVKFLQPDERFHNGKLKSDRTWECVCECGSKINVSAWALKNGNTKSCGCYRKAKLKENQRKATHGKTNTLLYRTWDGIKKRCYNKNANNYENYGGRGIKMCDEWKSDFQAFYIWAMNNGYKKELTIDRIDVNGNYCPENCRWVDIFQQASNKRKSIRNKSGYVGISYSETEKRKKRWCSRISIKHKIIRLGWYFTQKEALEARNKYIIDNGLDYPIQEYKGEIGGVNN